MRYPTAPFREVMKLLCLVLMKQEILSHPRQCTDKTKTSKIQLQPWKRSFANTLLALKRRQCVCSSQPSWEGKGVLAPWLPLRPVPEGGQQCFSRPSYSGRVCESQKSASEVKSSLCLMKQKNCHEKRAARGMKPRQLWLGHTNKLGKLHLQNNFKTQACDPICPEKGMFPQIISKQFQPSIRVLVV